MSSLPLAATLPEAITPAPGVVQVSQRLGRFVLLHKLGAGGMGTVFSAYDEQLDRKVALKLLHPMEHEQAASRQRVLREAQAMARVSDQNVVHVYEVGELGEQIFIAMEYIDGVTLGDWQKRQPRSWQELLRMYRQAGEGLLAAHQTGLVHRDRSLKTKICLRNGYTALHRRRSARDVVEVLRISGADLDGDYMHRWASALHVDDLLDRAATEAAKA